MNKDLEKSNADASDKKSSQFLTKGKSEIIEKILKPYGVLKDGRVTRLCMLKAISLENDRCLRVIDKRIKVLEEEIKTAEKEGNEDARFIAICKLNELQKISGGLGNGN